jgi:GNAT superfamily N-acetyltransferase
MIPPMPPGRVHVEPVGNAKAQRDFAEFPYHLYREDPTWVPPLRSTERRRWLPQHNASLHNRWNCRFLVRRDGRVAGRIAAAIDPVFAERWQVRSGFFGFYECRPDPEASRVLFEAAESVLRERGVEWVFGPVNLSTHDEVGLLVDGFSRPPTLLTTYNPPYYESQVESAGYLPHLDYHAYHCDPKHAHDPGIDRLVRMAGRTGGDRASVTVRASDPLRWETDLRIMFDLYNRSFEDLWGFVPISWDEFMERARDFRPFYRPELSLVAECEGRPIGFAIGLPDINVALAGLGGRLWPLGFLRLARRVPRIRSLRLMLLGVLPDFAGRGVAARLAFEMASAARRLGMHESELSLVQATNRKIQHVIGAFGGVPVKTYRLYAKPLAI